MCTQPVISDCNHWACKKCWIEWLKRSNSCPVCRVPTTKDSLALMVFKETGVDAISLTQKVITAGDREDSSDDEEREGSINQLEIVGVK